MSKPTEPLSRKRSELPPKERAVSDTLDEYLSRHYGIFTSWTNPDNFISWLEKRGYTISEYTVETQDE